jgi:hypothetical protein
VAMFANSLTRPIIKLHLGKPRHHQTVVNCWKGPTYIGRSRSNRNSVKTSDAAMQPAVWLRTCLCCSAEERLRERFPR